MEQIFPFLTVLAHPAATMGIELKRNYQDAFSGWSQRKKILKHEKECV